MVGATELSTDLESDTDTDFDPDRQITLCETLDRVLNKGVVVAGEIIISVADIDLVYLNLQVLLTSVETARRSRRDQELLSPGGAL
jgi:gas vesicle structural protein